MRTMRRIKIDKPPSLATENQRLEIVAIQGTDFRIVVINAELFFIKLPALVLRLMMPAVFQAVLAVNIIFLPQFFIFQNLVRSVNANKFVVSRWIVLIFVR